MDQGVSEKELKRLQYKGELPYFYTEPNVAWEPFLEPGGFNLPMIFRDEWEGLPPNSELEPLQVPVSYIRLIPTNTNKQVDPDVIQALQVYQKFYMVIKGLPDMPYNFLVDIEGAAYEVAGWHSDVPKEKEFSYLKGNCLDVGLIGDFRYEDPPYDMMRAVLELVKFGIKKNAVKSNFQIIPFRTFSLRNETKLETSK